MSEHTKALDTEKPEKEGKKPSKPNKKERAESAEKMLELTVAGGCKSKGRYLGLREKQRDELGVNVGDEVTVIDDTGKKHTYTVGLGSKELKKDEGKFTINGFPEGAKLKIVNTKPQEEKGTPNEPTPETAAKDTRQKISNKLGTHMEPDEQEDHGKKPHGKEHKSERRGEGHDQPVDKHIEPEHPAKHTEAQNKVTPHESATPSAEQKPAEEAKKEGFFKRAGKWAWNGTKNLFKKIGTGITNIVSRGNKEDPLGFKRQTEEVKPASLIQTPFYMVGDMIDGTVMNVIRRGYEILSPIGALPKAIKGKKKMEQVGEVFKALGTTLKNTILSPFRLAYEAWLGLAQKPVTRVGLLVEKFPIVGGFVGTSIQGIAALAGTPVKWIVKELPEDIMTVITTGSLGGSAHGGHGDSHGAGHAAAAAGHDTHAAGGHEEHKEEGHEEASHGAAETHLEPEQTKEPQKEPEHKENQSADQHAESNNVKANPKLFEALENGKYGPDPTFHYPLNKETVLQYFTLEHGAISPKTGTNVQMILRNKNEAYKWQEVAVKIIKYIRKELSGGAKITTKELVEYGLPKEMVQLFKESLGNAEFEEVMSGGGNESANGNGNENGADEEAA
jgi:hypothetical protein